MCQNPKPCYSLAVLRCNVIPHSTLLEISTDVGAVPDMICHVTMKESIDVLLWG
jgi:hypothetical protein